MIITPAVFKKQQARHLTMLNQGAVFIYPTDTIYGIGCDATNPIAVQKVRSLKQRDTKPFSVIAPSKEWILENCVVLAEGRKWVDKLPGPYTLIFTLKNVGCIAADVNNGADTIGVRIPDHWIATIARQIDKPIVTTSVNLSGQPHAKSLTDVAPAILSRVDFAIDEGTLAGRPSTLVNLTGENAVETKR